MKISKIKDFFVSVEVIPPLRGHSIDEIYKVVDKIAPFNPAFISVTKHPAELEYYEVDGRILKLPKVRRPGTMGIVAALKMRYDIDVVPHLTCIGNSKFELEELLIDLDFIGIDNVFVVRGDKKRNVIKKDGQYEYAYQLVEQIFNMNKGKYLYQNAKKTDFCIGVAGYPEKHFESPNMTEDIKYLKRKIEAGAKFVITQMFFDEKKYIDFVERLKKENITIPIIPGIKPITSYKSAKKLPGTFFIDIPEKLLEDLREAKTEKEEFFVGIRHTIKMIEKLREYGIPGIHIFTMSKPDPVLEILKNI
ncbi:methylenetetrahydrofolate reductase [Thermosipho melanesiensis]|uniref:Methylenetetrahydrofolate reductase n=2 Tax=Thermosipho melanesiensis TaxID=46541 RepID=A6LKZ4_THEM4|nr:methylenetetrahydrofolate reductase [Thermosipho melanesiensis]ABR30595.1 Methylenetetrahydrofolate reductase (NAD(P)H) [Thermosipho melanesiensis BI429]APT73738.1 methylenetetrahydrofolate reductase [Thermosipho melanesiensis]OOC35676.1 methylenetetrahydrofolate reductase [Thermosipho melanesiensis]OOC38975.1 methylenetetrahydrofolate reductase [Thermosipho melanesiensis]OOC39123.1 methylenetetrahydrofolate reductase [Thermosipho melanesiensis]